MEKQNNTVANTAQNTEAEPLSFKALFVIIEHGYADEVCELLFEKGFRLNMTFHGKGTAASHLLDILGLGDSTRDIILSIVETKKSRQLICELEQKLETTGIAFSVRLNSIGGRKIIKILQGDYSHETTNK